MNSRVEALGESPLALDGDAHAELEHLASRAKRRATRGQAVFCSLSVPIVGPVDPAAVALTAEEEKADISILELPSRQQYVLASIGVAMRICAGGPGRFGELEKQWRELCATAVTAGDASVAGSGLVAHSSFAFSPSEPSAQHWREFRSAELTVPRVTVARLGEQAVMTVNLEVTTDSVVAELVEETAASCAALTNAPMPLLDPDPVSKPRVATVLPPEHFESAVRRATEREQAGEFEKIVLAREVRVHATNEFDLAAVFGILREQFPACYSYCIRRDETAFIGATPELLARCEGSRVSTVALAGSTTRSADPAVDNHLGERLLQSAKDRHEQAVVAERIEQALGEHALWVTAADQPSLVKVANIQHLATAIRAQLAAPQGALSVAGMLHPTPAVGAEPADAVGEIPALEGLDRGLYAGALGWIDERGDGEFVVALRCALIDGSTAHCFAGVGVVSDSEPADELAETEVKLQAVLPLLT